MYYVYCITNLIDNKKYIGITTNDIEIRFKQHIKEAKQGSERYLCRAIRKYGESNFKVEKIDETNDIEKLKKLEIKYIDEYNTFSNYGQGYNMTKGGDGTFGRICSEETRLKISLSNKGKIGLRGEKHPLYGKSPSEESNLRRSQKLKGRKIPPEVIEKRKEMWSKRDWSGANNPNYGRKHTEESKLKMSENSWYKTEEGKVWAKKNGERISGENNPMYGKKHTEETLNVLREKSLGGNNPRAKRLGVFKNDILINVYACIKDAVGFEGITRKQLDIRIKKGKEYKGYIFRIISEDFYNQHIDMRNQYI